MGTKIKKGFTLIELVVTLAVASILISTISAFLVFVANISSQYRELDNNLHSANRVANIFKNYIDYSKEGELELNDSWISETPIDSGIVFSFQSSSGGSKIKDYLSFNRSSETELPYLTYCGETLYVCKSNMDLKITNNRTNEYLFSIYFSSDQHISFTKIIK